MIGFNHDKYLESQRRFFEDEVDSYPENKMDIKVTLINFDGKGSNDEAYFAARILAYTKNTRLNLTPGGLKRYMEMPVADLEDELKYMVRTLPSSWEFAHLTFAIENISRAAAQQITRTRIPSYAMQAQRVVDVGNAGCYIPTHLEMEKRAWYKDAMDDAVASYRDALEMGIEPQDARGLLPMHIHCNLIEKLNLRSFADLCHKRVSLRVQEEYREVCRQMRAEAEAVWPWVSPFLEPRNKEAVKIIEEIAATLPKEQKLLLAKAADMIKTE